MSTDKSTNLKKKKLVFLIIALAIAILIIWVYWTNTNILTDYFTIQSERIPESFDGVRIAHISDLHNKDWEDKLSLLLIKEKPDYIFLTGDMIDSRKTDVKVTLNFLEKIKDLAPIYYVNGNHEGRLYNSESKENKYT